MIQSAAQFRSLGGLLKFGDRLGKFRLIIRNIGPPQASSLSRGDRMRAVAVHATGRETPGRFFATLRGQLPLVNGLVFQGRELDVTLTRGDIEFAACEVIMAREANPWGFAFPGTDTLETIDFPRGWRDLSALFACLAGKGRTTGLPMRADGANMTALNLFVLSMECLNFGQGRS
jgi:hypothetical protein